MEITLPYDQLEHLEDAIFRQILQYKRYKDCRNVKAVWVCTAIQQNIYFRYYKTQNMGFKTGVYIANLQTCTSPTSPLPMCSLASLPCLSSFRWIMIMIKIQLWDRELKRFSARKWQNLHNSPLSLSNSRLHENCVSQYYTRIAHFSLSFGGEMGQ